MTIIIYFQLIFLLIIIICYTQANEKRQIIDGTYRNMGVPQEKPIGSIPLNNQNIIAANQQNYPKILSNNNNNNNNPSFIQPQQQIEPARSRGFYNSPLFQPSPFSGEKPSGWFGTNYVNWVSNRDSELDKNKLAEQKYSPPTNIQENFPPPRRDDGGADFLRKVAKQYASKGLKAFNFGEYESRVGHGVVCTNHENFDGYTFGKFPCPLPASTGMNQQDQFCCGPANYQYCCNAQEFSQNQRGGFSDHRVFNDQRYPKRPTYSTPTKRILSIILPIASVVVLTGIVVLVFLYYKRIRNEQNRTRKPDGAIRLDDNYTIIPQELPNDKSMLN